LSLTISIDCHGPAFAQAAQRADPEVSSSMRQVRVRSATPRQKPRGPVITIWEKQSRDASAARRTLPTQFMKTEIIRCATRVRANPAGAAV
jgi:hypothetical protein